jgi:hypothetical protein
MMIVHGILFVEQRYFCDHTFGSCSCRSILCCGKNADHYYNRLTSKEELRGILKFHFKSPFEKWNSKEHRRFPWKLLVQIICIILVTTQVSMACMHVHSNSIMKYLISCKTLGVLMISMDIMLQN